MKTLTITSLVLTMGILAQTAYSEKSESINSSFVLTGGYDTRLGDQWGIAFKADSFMVGFSLGGFIYSDAANQAADDTNRLFDSRYNEDLEIEGDAFTYSFYIAGIVDPEASGSLYYGIGFSSANIDVTIPDFQGVEATGNFDDFLADFFIGVIGKENNGFFYDLRLGYGYSMGFSGDGEITGNGQSADFEFEDESFLEGVYGMVSLGFSF